MNELFFDARLIDFKHTEHRYKVRAVLLPDGIHIPIRVVKNTRVFELVRISDNSTVVYRQVGTETLTKKSKGN